MSYQHSWRKVSGQRVPVPSGKQETSARCMWRLRIRATVSWYVCSLEPGDSADPARPTFLSDLTRNSQRQSPERSSHSRSWWSELSYGVKQG